jgi:HNH endonuclease
MPHKVNCYSLSEEQAQLVRYVILTNYRPQPNIYLKSSCWIWLRGKIKSGYGHFLHRVAQTRRLHRLTYMAFVGPIPPNKPLVRHLCHNRLCCRPSHLAVGNQQDNIDDMVRAGRLCKYGKNWLHLIGNTLRAKISPQQVCEMYDLRAAGATTRALSQKYGLVSRGHIRQILKGKAWQQVWTQYHSIATP